MQPVENISRLPIPETDESRTGFSTPLRIAPAALHHLVSVITPTHNASAVIARAIHSVAAQTIPVLEHIVIDDGSRDDTFDLIQSLRREYPHIRYIQQPWRGAAHARNLGIEMARGRYIAFLDSDDLWQAYKLEHQIRFMESSGTLFSYGDYRICDPDTGRIVEERRSPPWIGYEDLLARCPIGCLTVAYNQERLGKVYMPLVKRGQDWGMWLELTRRGIPALKYPGIEAVYYARSGSLSSNKLLKCLDIYHIYRHQEGLSPLAAIWRLFCFSWSSLQKWKR